MAPKKPYRTAPCPKCSNPMEYRSHMCRKCSNKIKAQNHRLSPESKAKIGRSGEQNAMWLGDKASKAAGNKRARRLFPCIKGKQRHHKDGNPLNNNPSNIIIVTPKEHLQTDGRLNRLIEISKKRTKPETKLCPQCKGQKTSRSKLCQACSKKNRDSKGRFVLCT